MFRGLCLAADLHVRVVWPAGALRGDPVNILAGLLDIASLAVHAVLRVDLESPIALVVGNHFVDTRRAVALRRFVELA